MCEGTVLLFKCLCTEQIFIHCVENPIRESDKATMSHRTKRTASAVPNSLRGLHFPLPGCEIKFVATPYDSDRKRWITMDRLCPKCRETRLKLMNSVKPGSREWPNRYEWKTWDAFGLPQMKDQQLENEGPQPLATDASSTYSYDSSSSSMVTEANDPRCFEEETRSRITKEEKKMLKKSIQEQLHRQRNRSIEEVDFEHGDQGEWEDVGDMKGEEDAGYASDATVVRGGRRGGRIRGMRR